MSYTGMFAATIAAIVAATDQCNSL